MRHRVLFGSIPLLLLVAAVFVRETPAQRTIAPPPVRALPASDKRWALLIGVDQYDGEVNPLHGAANDALQMKPVLVKYAGFAEDRVTVLASGAAKASLLPTRANVLAELDRILAQMPTDGLLLLQFSGHGIDRDGHPFLLTKDARIDGSLELVSDTSLSVEALNQRIRKKGIAQVLVLLDACRNDPSPGKRGDADNPLTKNYVDGLRFALRNDGVHAFATLYATAVGERAWENTRTDRGYFLSAVGDALSGKAANPRTGEVTLAALVKYVKEQVPDQVRRDRSGARQLPFPDIQGYADDLVLSVVPEMAERRPEPPPAPQRPDLGKMLADLKDCNEARAFERVYGSDADWGRAAQFKVAALCPAPVTAPPPAAVETLRTDPAPRPRRTGDVQLNPKDGQRYVWVEPGTFRMGCSPGDSECFDFEKPTRDVTLTKGFWIAETPVTVGAWKKVYGDVPDWDAKWTIEGKERDFNPGWADLTQPVIGVTWDESQAFCAAARPGGRLPTEAEYEYAARAGSTSVRYGELDQIAWYGDNSGKKRLDTTKLWSTDFGNYIPKLRDNGNGPHPVGTKRPNAWGLYDILGNVWSWTGDWWDENYYKSGDVTDPKGPKEGKERVLRGGSWSFSPRLLRASVRLRNDPALRFINFGARCVGE